MEISGAIGITLLKNKNNNIFIYYDDHSNNKYCNNLNNTYMSDMMKQIIKKTKNISILVEEPLIKTDYLDFMWEDSVHLKEFLDFYSYAHKNDFFHSVDIRNSLVYFSLFVAIDNAYDDKDHISQNIKFYDYIYPILLFHDLVELDNDKLNKNKKLFNDIISIKKLLKASITKLDNNNKKQLTILLDKLKTRIKDYYNKYKKYNNTTLKELLKTNNKTMQNIIIKGYPYTYYEELSWIDEFTLIIDTTMEIYTLAILLSNLDRHNILYLGLAHCSNICYFLRTMFDYEVKFCDGFTEKDLTDFSNVNKFPNIMSCIKNITLEEHDN